MLTLAIRATGIVDRNRKMKQLTGLELKQRVIESQRGDHRYDVKEPTLRMPTQAMDNLLSLEQAAKILGVEYKTAYRLVRAGKIPAGKVGRVYRIKREDLDAYFESTKQKLAAETDRELTPLEGLRCCVTGKRIVSELDIGGYASDTGQPICRQAWDEGWRTTDSADRDQPNVEKSGDAQ